ncbi:hypothetical protein KEJ25_06060 [Candidatus Bathyarchaeota archaeon]|nr:hypothetical protein [Candidatus Bathyarchaeota archaeon]
MTSYNFSPFSKVGGGRFGPAVVGGDTRCRDFPSTPKAAYETLKAEMRRIVIKY